MTGRLIRNTGMVCEREMDEGSCVIGTDYTKLNPQRRTSGANTFHLLELIVIPYGWRVNIFTIFADFFHPQKLLTQASYRLISVALRVTNTQFLTAKILWAPIHENFHGQMLVRGNVYDNTHTLIPLQATMLPILWCCGSGKPWSSLTTRRDSASSSL